MAVPARQATTSGKLRTLLWRDESARDRAVACARRLFCRPESIVDALIASFCNVPEAQYAGHAAVARTCYDRPIQKGATREIFGLRARHWPVLNLLDAADHDRRAFADAMSAAVAAARAPTAP